MAVFMIVLFNLKQCLCFYDTLLKRTKVSDTIDDTLGFYLAPGDMATKCDIMDLGGGNVR